MHLCNEHRTCLYSALHFRTADGVLVTVPISRCFSLPFSLWFGKWLLCMLMFPFVSCHSTDPVQPMWSCSTVMCLPEQLSKLLVTKSLTLYSVACTCVVLFCLYTLMHLCTTCIYVLFVCNHSCVWSADRRCAVQFRGRCKLLEYEADMESILLRYDDCVHPICRQKQRKLLGPTGPC